MHCFPGFGLVMHPSGCGRSGGRVVEGARLESEYTAKPYRGFESLPLRQLARSLAGFEACEAQADELVGRHSRHPALGQPPDIVRSDAVDPHVH